MTKDIFSKLINDCNNELELILEKKDFSSDVKSLLLSMLYKIENSYEDYKKVKVNVCTKKQFTKEILETIEKKCKIIEIIKPMSEEGQYLYEKGINCIIDKENGKIRTFQNEKSMLDAILQMRQENIDLNEKYDLIAMPITELLLIGNNINSLEIITDFNGWSWDITTNNKNIAYNKLYQIIIILIGNKQIDCWINKRDNSEVDEIPSNVILSSKYNENFGITKREIVGEKIDYIEQINNKFIELYGEELSKEFFEKALKLLILECSKRNNEYKKLIQDKIVKLKEELEKMEDNKIFIENLTKQKREITRKIEGIDKLLNSNKELKLEYENINKNLPNKEKIFSVSHLKLMLEKERRKKIEEIQIINKKMEPKEFIKIKEEIKDKLYFYEDIKIQNESIQNYERLQKELESTFLKCMKIKIKNAQENIEISRLIYMLRYYKMLEYNKINNVECIEKQLIEKACKQKVLTKFSENNNLNYEILREIFNSKIIDLDSIVYTLKYSKGILTVKVFDGDIEENCFEINITEKVELLSKLNKKIKIWQKNS